MSVDKDMGLVCLRTISSLGVKWYNARMYCWEVVVDDNRRGWRLPMLEELQSLMDLTQSNPPSAGHPFINVLPGTFWSATFPSAARFAYTESFHGNGIVYTDMTDNGGLGVWCVRGGQDITPQ